MVEIAPIAIDMKIVVEVKETDRPFRVVAPPDLARGPNLNVACQAPGSVSQAWQ